MARKYDSMTPADWFRNSTLTMSGTKNGHPTWTELWGRHSIWYENGKWQVGHLMDTYTMVQYTSNTSADCPDLVESWSTGTNTWINFIEKIACRPTIETGKLSSLRVLLTYALSNVLL